MRSSRERLRRKRLNEMVRRQQLEDLEVQKDAWMTRHGLKTGFEFTREQKRELKRWFNFLDADGSGEINIEELEDPLLSTGVLRLAVALRAFTFVLRQLCLANWLWSVWLKQALPATKLSSSACYRPLTRTAAARSGSMSSWRC